MSRESVRGRGALPLHLVVPSYEKLRDEGVRKDIAYSFTSDEEDYLAELVENLSAIGYEPLIVKIGLDDYRETLAVLPKGSRVLYLCDGNEVSDGVCGVTPLEFLEGRELRLCANGSAFVRNTTYKETMKELFLRSGVPSPAYVHLAGPSAELGDSLRYPLIAKPANLYGAVGIDDDSVLLGPAEAALRLPGRLKAYGGLIVEEFIVGREFTAFLLDGGIVHGILERAFDRARLPPLRRFMSYERIWLEEGSAWDFLAVEDQNLVGRIAELAARAYRAVAGSQYARVDIRYEEEKDELFALEVNAPSSLSAWDSGAESVRLSGNGTVRELLGRILSDAWGEGKGRRGGESASEPRTASRAFPSRVASNAYGLGLFATSALGTDEAVAQYDGVILSYDQVPEEEKRYAILLQDDEWLVDRTAARYINHSCDPNCRVAEDCTVYTCRPVAAGEELSISYNKIPAKELVAGRSEPAWDENWSFDCRCGSPRCQGRVDGYRVLDESNRESSQRLYVCWTEGRGRGVFARARIEKGELIERAPVIVIPAEQWGHIEKTLLFDYCFAWGDELEHAALAGGCGSFYNHSYAPNAVYYKRLDDLFIDFTALRAIEADEEITINYNGEPEERRPLWFPVKEDER